MTVLVVPWTEDFIVGRPLQRAMRDMDLPDVLERVCAFLLEHVPVTKVRVAS